MGQFQKTSTFWVRKRWGKGRVPCGVLELFHSIHRFIHRPNPQVNDEKENFLVYITVSGGFRQISYFSSMVFFTMGKNLSENKVLTGSPPSGWRKKQGDSMKKH